MVQITCFVNADANACGMAHVNNGIYILLDTAVLVTLYYFGQFAQVAGCAARRAKGSVPLPWPHWAY